MILTIDVGTSALKAGVFEMNGSVVARTSQPVPLFPHPDPLRHEVDAREWLHALRQATGKIMPREVDAVVVSGNGPTLVPVSADGEPLANAMTWMDRRGIEEARIVSQVRGRATDAAFCLPKALWLYRNQPGLYGRARWLFSCPEYVTFIMTGEAVTFLPTPDYTQSIMWDADAVRALGMDPGKFPPFVDSGSRMGRVTDSGAAATGIPSGTPVIAGAPDFIVAILGTATVAPGRACIRSGTSEGINVCSPTPTGDERLMCVSHMARGLYNVSGVVSTSGKALEWFKNATGKSNASYDNLFDDITQIPAGANRLLFLPYLSGERTPIWDPLARGAFVGLTLNHHRRDMTRAVVESVAYAIRDVIEVMEETGVRVEDLRITGTPSRSPLWNQVKADVTGRRLLVPAVTDADLAGDACLALYGLGERATIAEASESIVSMGAVFEPDASRRRIYDEMFALYREAYLGLRAVFARLSTPGGAS